MAGERTRGRAGSDVELDLGSPTGASKVAAYHAVPARGRAKGVLVLSEAGELDEFVRDACDRLTRCGFATLAPDLTRAIEDRMEAAIRQLLDDNVTEGPRVGVLSFASGALDWLAAADPLRRIACVVDCAGPRADAGADAPEAEPLSLPTLLLFGERDARVAGARRLADALPTARLLLVPDADEGFLDASRADRHRAEAAASAWDALRAFFEASL